MTDAELAIVVKLKDMFTPQLDKIVASTDKATTKMTSSWKKFIGGVELAKTVVAGWVTGQVAQAVTGTVQFASTVDRATTGFRSLSTMIGTNATQAMEGLRKATNGEIGDMELMASANRAVMLGAVDTEKELIRLAEAGQVLGEAMGLGGKEGIDQLSSAFANQNTRALKAIGVIVNMDEVYERLGLTVGDLSEKMKRDLFEEEFWRKAGMTMEALGGETAGLTQQVERLEASWSNLKKSLAESVTPVLQETLEFWSGALSSLAPTAKPKRLDTGPAENLKNEPAWVQELAAKYALEDRVEAAKNRTNVLTEQEKMAQGTKDMFAGYRRAYMTEGSLKKSQTHLPEIIETVVPMHEKLWAAMGEGVEDYYKKVSDTMRLVGDTIYRSLQDIEQNIGEVFFDTMMGKMKTFKEYLRAFVTDIARTLSQMMARNAMAGLISSIGSSIGGLFGSTVAGGSPGGGGGAAGMAGESDNMFAYGGITTGTSIAGERGPEAVVPLPGSRSIPVEMRGGGGGGNVTYIINAIDTQSFAAALMGNKASIHRIVTEGLGMDTQLRAAARAV
jgi:hypothetical protein